MIDRGTLQAVALAREGLALLDLQQKYFRFRSADLLAECKAAEKKFRQRCQETIKPKAKPTPSMFGEAPEGAPPDGRR